MPAADVIQTPDCSATVRSDLYVDDLLSNTNRTCDTPSGGGIKMLIEQVAVRLRTLAAAVQRRIHTSRRYSKVARVLTPLNRDRELSSTVYTLF